MVAIAKAFKLIAARIGDEPFWNHHACCRNQCSRPALVEAGAEGGWVGPGVWDAKCLKNARHAGFTRSAHPASLGKVEDEIRWIGKELPKQLLAVSQLHDFVAEVLQHRSNRIHCFGRVEFF